MHRTAVYVYMLTMKRSTGLMRSLHHRRSTSTPR
ncbi:hypothetical protein JI435_403220 [Parastagonospora nodorum SN15]|uniref:Uncharacterized protein n=1 Tax=Phaeosphaeria nodorum (strain SN15 / ATCC MYA-4574 / FGSC 10173) TaxID=321614 RepID=A0A7U2HW79_PHANO|nr:hypothetical protein JI435_403220 [Parastagonospora nodorum SN15]